jgi:hypothetical protein
MSLGYPSCGARRIQGESLRLGIEFARYAVAKHGDGAVCRWPILTGIFALEMLPLKDIVAARDMRGELFGFPG